MIVDVHTHFWNFPRDFSNDFVSECRRARPDQEVDLSTHWAAYQATCPAGEEVRSILFGGKAKLAGIWSDDRDIAGMVAKYPDRLVGFMSLDPTQPGWEDEMRFGHQELRLRGIKLLPMYAGFYPDDSKLDPLWEYARKHQLPVLLHTGTTFISKAPLDCTVPRLIDRVAIRYPDVKIIMAHLSHPYEGECAVVIRKHANVYADISALHYRPFQLYHSLMLIQEYGVWNKVLFGTDFPFTTVEASVSGVRALNNFTTGTGLPQLKSDQIEAMIHRDSLALLGLA